jgi:hypothetical protein
MRDRCEGSELCFARRKRAARFQAARKSGLQLLGDPVHALAGLVFRRLHLQAHFLRDVSADETSDGARGLL